MQTLDAIFTRRSIRSFLSSPVSDAQMETLLQAAAAAPSGSNAQTRFFLSVRDPRRLEAVRALAPGIIDPPPAVIVLCMDGRGRADLPARERAMDDNAIGAALQNLLLAAHDLGLGGCAVGSFHAAGLAVLLGLPEGVEPRLLVTVGKPAFVPAAPKKRRLEEIAFAETWEERHG